jgi:hypothetical protein
MLAAGGISGRSSSIAKTCFLRFHNCDPYIDSGDFPNFAKGRRTSSSFAPHPRILRGLDRLETIHYGATRCRSIICTEYIVPIQN